jgi:hypothetical protein
MKCLIYILGLIVILLIVLSVIAHTAHAEYFIDNGQIYGTEVYEGMVDNVRYAPQILEPSTGDYAPCNNNQLRW